MGQNDHRIRVSVIVPAHNAAGTLGPCLRSVRRQTEAGWECLVIDDGSVDDTAEVAARFCRTDERFRLLRRDHGGIVQSLNAGLDACHGRYVARMDADDLMHRDRLGLQLAALEGGRGLDAVGCHVRLFPRAALGPGILAYERWVNSISTAEGVRTEAFVECPIVHPTLVARAAILRSLAYRDRGWPEDYDLVLRMIEAGCRIAVVPRRLLLWRARGPRLSFTDSRYRIDAFRACKAHFLCRSLLRDTRRYVLWGYGSTGRKIRTALLAHARAPSRIVEIHPGRLGNTIHGARVVPPDEVRPEIDRPMVVAVAGRDPRQRIRDFLRRRGFVETRDFVCVA
jgi:glycosyltransferase involved in cell wall biosynthesis